MSIKPVAAVVLVVFAAAFVPFWLQRAAKERKTDQKDLRTHFFYCSRCEKAFEAPGGTPSAKCPTCGLVSNIIRYMYRCSKCSHVFAGCDGDTSTFLYRVLPDGEWFPEFPLPPPCPKCESPQTESM